MQTKRNERKTSVEKQQNFSTKLSNEYCLIYKAWIIIKKWFTWSIAVGVIVRFYRVILRFKRSFIERTVTQLYRAPRDGFRLVEQPPCWKFKRAATLCKQRKKRSRSLTTIWHARTHAERAFLSEVAKLRY